MKGLIKYIEKVKPNFEKGSKLEKFMPLFESFETFLLVLGKTTPKKGAHIRDAMDSKRLMSVVVISLIPALLFGMWNVGYQHYMSIAEQFTFLDAFVYGALRVVPLIAVSYAAGLGTEFLFVYIKGKEIEEGFLVSGMLIPLIVPVDVPLWILAVATIFAVIIGKEVFGGTGMNIVNPALLARAFLFFAYPSKMSGDKIWISGLVGQKEDGAGHFINSYGDKIADGFSGATPLATAAAATDNLDAFHAHFSVTDMFMGWIPGSVGETSVLMILIGAAILLFTGVGSWKIMLAGLIGGGIMGYTLNLLATDTNVYMSLPFYEHFLLGGFAFGLVFMATDPVTAAQTERGKWIYGFLVGSIAILIRVLNPAYPEGVMLAILLMNIFAPLIDHYVIRSNVKKRLSRIKAQ